MTNRRKCGRPAAAIAVAAFALTGCGSSTTHHSLDLQAGKPRSTALAIPCPTCFAFDQPKEAHIGGTEYDAGELTDQHGSPVGHFSLVSIGVTPFAGEESPGELQLSATMVIGDDQLVAQGLEEPPVKGGHDRHHRWHGPLRPRPGHRALQRQHGRQHQPRHRLEHGGLT
jgi:hypothetical protein